MDKISEEREILKYLENVASASASASDMNLRKRIIRAVSAFEANVEEEVFTEEFKDEYMEKECSINPVSDLNASEKKTLDYLKLSKDGAKMSDDLETQVKLERAIAAFEADLDKKVLINE